MLTTSMAGPIGASHMGFGPHVIVVICLEVGDWATRKGSDSFMLYILFNYPKQSNNGCRYQAIYFMVLRMQRPRCVGVFDRGLQF